MRPYQQSLRLSFICFLPALITLGCVGGEGSDLVDPNEPFGVNISIDAGDGSGVTDGIPIQRIGNKPRAIVTASVVAGFAPLTTSLSADNSSGGMGGLEYLWDFDDGTQAEGMLVEHTFNKPGVYEILLDVTDANGESGNAILPIIVAPELSIVVSGSGSARSFFVQTDVPLASLFGEYELSWVFGDGGLATGDVVTHAYQSSGTFEVELTLKTGSTELRADTSEIMITSNGAVIADAGPDLMVNSGADVTLDASGSFGPQPLNYQWVQILGPDVAINSDKSSKLSFVAPVVSIATSVQFQLTVSGLTISDTDVVTVQIQPILDIIGGKNNAPIADAGSDIVVTDEDWDGQETVILYAGGSSDPDNDPLTFVWTIPGQTLPATTDPNTHVSLPVGVHNIDLAVSDPSGATRFDSLTATVIAGPGVLKVTGAALIFGGNVGGPMTPSDIDYTLRNDGDMALNWSLSGVPSWLTASKTVGSLAPGAQTTVSFFTNANALVLSAGLFGGTMVFADDTGNPSQNVATQLIVNQPSVLTGGPNGPSFSGNAGGPFTSTVNTITLSNTGAQSCNWTLTGLPSWLSASSTSGSLAASGWTNIIFSTTAAANSLAAGTHTATLTFTNTTTSDSFTRQAKITVTAPMAFSAAGNITYGWAGTATNNASAGTVAWQNPGNAATSDDNDATVTLSNNESQYLVFSNFNLGIDIPADAEITGIEFHIEAKTSTKAPVCTEAAIVKGGVIAATNLASDEIVGVYEYRGLYYGDDSERWGEAWTAADIESNDFGLAIRLSSTGNETVEVDSCRVLVHWAKAPTAAVQLQHAFSPMAPCSIHANVLGSTIGGSSWEKVGVKWTITGPGGWTMTTTDPRPGSWGASRSRNCATDMWGYNTAIYADVPGTYTLQATLYLEDGTTVSDSQQVTVASSTRAVRYLRDDGDDAADGMSLATAWATWEHAIDRLRDNMELVVQDDDVWNVTSPLTNRLLQDLENVVIRRSGDGANKPIIEATGSVAVLALLRLEDFVIDGIDIRGIATPAKGVLGSEGDVLRLTMANVDGSQGHNSFWEKNSGYYNRQFLAYNSNFLDINRYAFYLEGSNDHTLVFIGCRFESSTANPPTGEGLIRVGRNLAGPDVGHSVNVLWCDFEDNKATNGSPHGGLRLGASFGHCYQSRFNAVFGVNETADDVSVPLQYIKRYDGIWSRADSDDITAAERLNGLFVCNSVFTYNPSISGACMYFQKQGYYLPTVYANNLFLVETPGSAWNLVFSRLTDTDGSRAQFREFTLVNNAFVTPDPEASNNQIGIYDDSPVASVFQNGGRLENNLTPGAMDGKGRWLIQKTIHWNAGEANALSFVSGEGVLPLDTNDLSSSRNYMPTSGTFPLYETNGKPEPGVWVDYTGALRNHGDATWPVGPSDL